MFKKENIFEISAKTKWKALEEISKQALSLGVTNDQPSLFKDLSIYRL